MKLMNKTKEEKQKIINSWLLKWELTQAEGKEVLSISESKMSEYCNGKRLVPDYVIAHINTFNNLTLKEGQKIIEKKINK